MKKHGRTRQATDDNKIRRMRFACWITKATNTPSEYLILIAFPWQQWLRERASMLRYTYTACVVEFVQMNEEMRGNMERYKSAPRVRK